LSSRALRKKCAAVSNLIDNAVKYSGKDVTSVETEILTAAS
jgi:hypothetical protein